jgi:hypothetical protein
MPQRWSARTPAGLVGNAQQPIRMPGGQVHEPVASLFFARNADRGESGSASPFMVFLSPTEAERAQFEHWQRSTTIQAGLAKRAGIVLLRAQCRALSAISRRLAVGPRIVRRWLKRFPTSV